MCVGRMKCEVPPVTVAPSSLLTCSKVSLVSCSTSPFPSRTSFSLPEDSMRKYKMEVLTIFNLWNEKKVLES